MNSDWQQAMALALAEAEAAGAAGEVPVGAVVVMNGAAVARAGNRTLRDGDPTAHAEIVALRAAARAVGNHRLLGATVISTLEPCLMCCGALVHARVERLVFAAPDEKAGAVDVLADPARLPRLNHRVLVEQGPGAEDSARILRTFFRARRG